MKKSVDLAMRAHYDAAQDQVVLYPDKKAHPSLAGVRINLKPDTISDVKLREMLYQAGIISSAKVPFARTLNAWLEMPGVHSADVQLLQLLLAFDSNIAFVSTKGSAGNVLRTACLNYASSLGKETWAVTTATSEQQAGWTDDAWNEALPFGMYSPLLDGSFPSATFENKTGGVLQTEGLTDIQQVNWLVRTLPQYQHIVAIPNSFVKKSISSEALRERNGIYPREFKEMLHGYLAADYQAIVYVGMNEDGWVLEFDTDFNPR